MRMPKLAGALVIAMMVAASLHLSAKPASADTKSICAKIAAAELKIMDSKLPDFVKQLAIDALYETKKAAGCESVGA